MLAVGGGDALARLDPVGTWSCLVFGPPSLGDERILLQLGISGDTQIARLDSAAGRRWSPLTQWERRRGELLFADLRTGRQFEANLDHDTLGGSWHTAAQFGGWWCTPYTGSESDLPEADLAAANPVMPPLVPQRMATPNYPRKAIREAQEGRVVVCFQVNFLGAITDPEIIEISDEIFRLPTLNALARSQYVGWKDPEAVRPGCRSFIYRLDSIY